jgi:hypothetical protein
MEGLIDLDYGVWQMRTHDEIWIQVLRLNDTSHLG